jgi:TPR repeat protein
MKRLPVMLALSLLAAGSCLAQTGDAESEKRRQQELAKRQEQEARQRAEAERERERSQQGLQHPILRYPEDAPGKLRAPPSSAAQLLAQAVELERSGKGPEAVKMYVHAAREGSGKAALRLGEIYSTGIPGVARDYAHSLRWYSAAQAMGEAVPTKKP